MLAQAAKAAGVEIAKMLLAKGADAILSEIHVEGPAHLAPAKAVALSASTVLPQD